jgi:hypothetical protein
MDFFKKKATCKYLVLGITNVFLFTCSLYAQKQDVKTEQKKTLINQEHASLRPVRAKEDSKSILMGYYPANFQLAGSAIHVQNQFVGLGDKLCVWVHGNYKSEDLAAVLINDSVSTFDIKNIVAQYHPIQNTSSLFINIPEDAILYKSYKLKLMYEGKELSEIQKLFVVPAISKPQFTSTNGEIVLSNLNGGQAPYQYTWFKQTEQGAKILKSGQVSELKDIPSIPTDKQESSYSIMIKDANYLVLNQFTNVNEKGVIQDALGASSTFSLYPNPATTELYIKVDGSLPSESSYSIIDMQGKIIDQGILKTEAIHSLPIGHLAIGLYNLQIRNNTNEILSTSSFVKF